MPGLPEAPNRLGGTDFDQALTALATAVLAGLSLWLLVATLAVGLGMHRHRLTRCLIPAWLVGVLTGGALLTLGTSTAQAAPHDLDGLPLPDRAVTSVAPEQPPTPPESVVVTSGDCLWTIAREHLDPAASQADIAAATAAWHEANRAAIGADPNLIHPGQVLLAPAASGQDAR
ncbi:MAG: hypothetical protein QM597_04185 [Aeromicrobium sp.]|uniref:LysM peptidoglycan-binding domain-containing protein n=1 Tax=Aeromicrobium sp. TaxID=1871063 RepID=UPI0039E47EFF